MVCFFMDSFKSKMNPRFLAESWIPLLHLFHWHLCSTITIHTSLKSLWSLTSCSWALVSSFCVVLKLSSSSVHLLVSSRTRVRDAVSSEFCFSTVSCSSMTRVTSESGSMEPLDRRWNRWAYRNVSLYVILPWIINRHFGLPFLGPLHTSMFS